MKAEYFINVTNNGLTVHLFRGAGKTCLKGNKIPAHEEDLLGTPGRVVVLRNDKPYRIWPCKFCLNRYNLYREAEDALDIAPPR